jgi:hypothetical protein
MRDDLITVVTGEPRSGTSLQMQTLHLLGCPVEGESSFVRDSTELGKMRSEHSQNMNPHGFFEVPGVVLEGTRNLERFKGKVLKIVSSGAYPQRNGTPRAAGTPPEFVDKFILCVRDPLHIAVSQTGLFSQVLVGAGAEDGGTEPETWAALKSVLSPDAFIARTGGLVQWLAAQDDSVRSKFLPVLYDDMIDNPRETIQATIEHLDLRPSEVQIAAAVANVSSDLRRSAAKQEWPDALRAAVVIADVLFAALSSMDLGKLRAAAIRFGEFIAERLLENVRWVDDEDTWATVYAQVKRDIISDDTGLGTNLRAELPEYRRHQLLCCQCPHYRRDEEQTYQIDRPPDLGPLVRPLVSCDRDKRLRTVEVCKHCWQAGSIIDGEVLGAQRERGV